MNEKEIRAYIEKVAAGENMTFMEKLCFEVDFRLIRSQIDLEKAKRSNDDVIERVARCGETIDEATAKVLKGVKIENRT